MARRKVPSVDIVAVSWLDAAYRFQENDGEKVKPIPAVTVGVVVAMDKDHVKVAGELFSDADNRQITAIPRKMVHRIIQVGTIRLPEFAHP